MNKMAKLLALLLVSVLLLSLCACGAGDNSVTSAKADSSDSAPIGDSDVPATDAAPAGSAPGDDAAPAARMLDVLNVGNYGSMVFVGCWDPNHYFNPNASQGAKFLIYDQMFFQTENGAESRIFSDWYYADDLTLVLELKDNIYFSNGDKMTGEDVLYSLNLYGNGILKTRTNCVDLENCYYEGNTIYIKYLTVDARGPLQLIASVLNKDWVEGLIAQAGGDEKAVDWYDSAVICGSGPYALTDYATDSYGIFTLRDDYWGMEEYGTIAKTVNCYYYSDQTTMLIEFEQGKLDVAYSISATDAERILAGGAGNNAAVGFAYGNANVGYIFSDETDTFADVNKRLAFAHALDLEACTEMAFGLYGIPATSIFTANMKYCVDGLAYAYDPDLSRELLAAAGVDSIDFTLTCMAVSQFSSLAEITQYYEAEVGINMTLDIMEPLAAISILQGGNYAMQMGTGESNLALTDPDSIVGTYNTSPVADYNRGNTDPEFTEMIAKGLSTIDDDVRRECYEWIQHRMYDNCYFVPICDSSAGLVYNSEMFEAPYTPGIAAPNVNILVLK